MIIINDALFSAYKLGTFIWSSAPFSKDAEHISKMQFYHGCPVNKLPAALIQGGRHVLICSHGATSAAERIFLF